MAYGNGMHKLNPVEDGLVLSLLGAYCPAPKAILDAGCGWGDRLAVLHAALPGTALCGIDRDADNAKAARERCPSAEIRTGDLCTLPWAEGTFDAALCECTLSLTDDPAAALASLYRALRCGGVLLLGDLCASGGDEAVASGCGTVRRVFDRARLEQCLAKAGFAVREHRDCREALLTMAAQMIFDGSFCTCVDAGTAQALRKRRAGYALWVLEKEGEP